MTDTANEYSSAWAEGEEAQSSESSVADIKKKMAQPAQDEYITAYADLDAGQSVNGEDLKTVTPKDKTQVAGNIATNDSDEAAKENK